MTQENILAGKRILFVEDDLFFANMISKKLADLECLMVNTTNSKETFSVLEKEKPEAIVLDILLPGEMDGFGILERIKSNQNLKDVPVIILSNLSQTQDIERGIKLGAFRYLTKALVSPSEVIDSIKSALSSKKM